MSATAEAGLAGILEKVTETLAAKEAAAAELKKIESELKELQSMAVEQLRLSGLDGVRAAGKTWYTREFFGVTIPKGNREAVIEAAKAEGLEDYITVSTASLKAWLKEQRGDGELGAGTRFEGLISVYRETRLSHQTLS